MLYRTFTLALLLCLFSNIYSQSEFMVHFASNSAVISASEKTKLSEFINQNQTQLSKVKVSAHTDADGSDGFNQELSRKRADAVISYLRNSGVVVEFVEARGELEPQADNTTNEGKSQNRRVVISYSLNAPEDRSNKTEIKDGKKRYADLDELMAVLAPAPEVHCINNRKDTVLILKKGTVVKFYAYCFENYNPHECVEIRVTEAHRRSDMLLGGFSTKSGPDWLVSGGMLDVGAYQNDVELTLAESKPAGFFIPTENLNDSMQLYYADRTNMDWKLDPSRKVYTWDRNKFRGWYKNNRDQNIFCGVFFCRIVRAFTAKEKRKPLFIPAETTYSYFSSSGNWIELTADFSLDELNEIDKKISEESRKLADMNYYAFRSAKLQPINCDYFPGKALNLIVSNTSAEGIDIATVSMIFQKRNVVMNGTGNSLHHSFLNVPKNKKVKIVGIGLKDGLPVISLLDEQVDDKIAMIYEPCDEEAIKKKVKYFLD